MGKLVFMLWLACLPVLLAPTAVAEDQLEADFDYDAAIEDIPIESDVYGPDLTYTDDSGFEANLYGQVNLTYQGFDDGQETTGGIVDNGNWNTRLGFTLTQSSDDIILRARFETGLGLRNSALVSQEYEPPWIKWERTWLRWFEVAADSSYGTVSFGQGSTASDGTAGLDDSFTFVAGATDSSDGFGSFRFRDGNGDLTNVTIGRVNNSFDGARRFRLRYDTPVFSGIMASTSYGRNVLNKDDNTDYYDVALRWTGEIGDFAVRTAVGYQWLDNPDGADSRQTRRFGDPLPHANGAQPRPIGRRGGWWSQLCLGPGGLAGGSVRYRHHIPLCRLLLWPGFSLRWRQDGELRPLRRAEFGPRFD